MGRYWPFRKTVLMRVQAVALSLFGLEVWQTRNPVKTRLLYHRVNMRQDLFCKPAQLAQLFDQLQSVSGGAAILGGFSPTADAIDDAAFAELLQY